MYPQSIRPHADSFSTTLLAQKAVANILSTQIRVKSANPPDIVHRQRSCLVPSTQLGRPPDALVIGVPDMQLQLLPVEKTIQPLCST